MKQNTGLKCSLDLWRKCIRVKYLWFPKWFLCPWYLDSLAPQRQHHSFNRLHHYRHQHITRVIYKETGIFLLSLSLTFTATSHETSAHPNRVIKISMLSNFYDSPNFYHFVIKCNGRYWETTGQDVKQICYECFKCVCMCYFVFLVIIHSAPGDSCDICMAWFVIEKKQYLEKQIFLHQTYVTTDCPRCIMFVCITHVFFIYLLAYGKWTAGDGIAYALNVSSMYNLEKYAVI